MGVFLSSLSTCAAKDPEGSSFQCGLPDTFESDGDIAGLGVFIAFAVAVITSLFASVYVLVIEGFEYFSKRDLYYHKLRMLADEYLISLSDAQAVTSLALLVTANFYVGCTISAYHYDLVCSLVLMSSAAHIGSLAVMHKYFDVDKCQGWQRVWQWVRFSLRVFMVIASFVLSNYLFRHRLESKIFPSFKPASDDITTNNRTHSTGLVLPAVCFIDHPGQSNAVVYNNFTASPNWTRNYTTHASSNHSASNGNSNTSTFAVMPAFATFNSNDDLSSDGDLKAFYCLIGACAVAALTSFLLVLFKKQGTCGHSLLCRHHFAYLLRWGCFFTTYIIALSSWNRFTKLQNWMIGSGWFEGSDTGERSIDSFGQLMPLILLALPVLALIEALAEKSDPPQKGDANWIGLQDKRNPDGFGA
ncbi:uncharacterized protein CC84DRAFT_1176948 [Paraphaeosphaeria sporulosa]|uniref:Uncharacterized protein n=1 Tax=Paraphaeosphaeria sporulosa TaxID=1460663 RepID=A0A177CDK0_9PLEO|nr:uncharacterized protein CC84DRAFT_1176948 [Paraphaeosphaeria sporulosa]OAG04780.1 hypothetical protein CC84DRAFT_1176948 [Paraphaeosphaeria sporulosa]